MKSIIIKKNNLLLCFLLVIETFLIKFLQYKILPEKYFYDSIKILAIMNGSSITDKGFSFTAKFFNIINILNFKYIEQWSIMISVISLIFFILFFLKKNLNLTKLIFILTSFALLNIYVFNLSKDIIQLFVFLVIYFICCSKQNDKDKVKIIVLIFLVESIFFRTYYLIIGILVGMIYYVYIKLFTLNKNKTKKTGFILFTTFMLFLLMVYGLQLVSKENYMILINARNNSNQFRNVTDAVTMINDVFQNDSFLNFTLNYIINTFRILFPLELLVKGYKYVPFVIFQLFFTIILLKNIFRISKEKSLFLFIVMAFVMVSIIYEPDFGSIIRHESVLMLFILELINERKENINYEKSIGNNSNVQEIRLFNQSN